MLFSELRDALKGFIAGFSEPHVMPLDLKFSDPTAAVNAWYENNGYKQIAAAGGYGAHSWSGERVTINTALNHSVVWACNRIISESVGFLPLVMKQKKGINKETAFKHPMYSALHDSPGPEITAMRFRETLTSHCVLGGNAFAKIIRRSGTGTAIALDLLLPDQVKTDREKTGQKRLIYIVKDGNSAEQTFTVQRGKPHDILHIPGLGRDGVMGYSVISMARQSIGTAIAAEHNVGSFYRNGGRLPYLLKHSAKFRNDEDFKKFRENWESVYSQPHRAPILENDIEYKQIGLNMADAQLLETREFSIAELCRWFSVSPHMVGDLSHASFNNIEQLALEFVKFTLSFWLTRWEQELWRCVLTDDEKGDGYFFKHNLSALLRGDFASRMAGYATMLQNGYASQNEVRDLEDWNPFEGGDEYHIQLNMQTLPATGAAPAPSPQLVRLGPAK